MLLIAFRLVEGLDKLLRYCRPDQVDAHSSGQGYTPVIRVGNLHLVKAATIGRGSERSRPGRGDNNNDVLALGVRIGPARRRWRIDALRIGYANDGAGGVEVAASLQSGLMVGL